jgi:hypothetical protein
MSVVSGVVASSAVGVDGPVRVGGDLDVFVAGRLAEMAVLSVGDVRRNRLRDEVICACLPVVRRLAARFFGRGESPEDLV